MVNSYLWMRLFKRRSPAEHHEGVQGRRVKGLQDVAEKTKALKKFSDKTFNQLENLRITVNKQEEVLEQLQTQLAIVEAAAMPKFIISDSHQKWHVA